LVLVLAIVFKYVIPETDPESIAEKIPQQYENFPGDEIPDAEAVTTNEKLRYSEEDKIFGVLSPFMQIDEVVSLLGEPDQKGKAPLLGNSSNRMMFEMQYGSIKLYFDTVWNEYEPPFYGLSYIYCTEPDKEVVRGISTGSTKEDVLSAFCQEESEEGFRPMRPNDFVRGSTRTPFSGKEGAWLYGDTLTVADAFGGIGNGEYGIIMTHEDGTESIEYSNVRGGQLVFNMDATDRVVSVYWSLGYVRWN
jgi:hypothetical protein